VIPPENAPHDGRSRASLTAAKLPAILPRRPNLRELTLDQDDHALQIRGHLAASFLGADGRVAESAVIKAECGSIPDSSQLTATGRAASGRVTRFHGARSKVRSDLKARRGWTSSAPKM
jgi:hypothetical protein